jgi:hypothetical protein
MPNQVEKLCIRYQGRDRGPAQRDLLAELMRPLTAIVKRGTSLFPHDANPYDSVGGLGGCGDRLAHVDDLRLVKGPGFLTRCHNSSFCIVSSPMRLIAAPSSAWAGSISRSLSAASMPESPFSRHFSIRYIYPPQLARQRLHGLASQNAQHDFPSAGGTPALPRSQACCHHTLCRGHSGRPTAPLRCPGLRLQFLRLFPHRVVLLGHGHLPQIRVQENRGRRTVSCNINELIS